MNMDNHTEVDGNPQAPPSSGRYWWYDSNGWWFWDQLAYAWKEWPALLGWSAPTKRQNQDGTGLSDTSEVEHKKRRFS